MPGEDATFQVALEHFVLGQHVGPCGKLRAHPESSARGDLGTAAGRVLDPQPFISCCRLQWILALVRWKHARAYPCTAAER